MKSAELPDVQMILQLESPPAQKKVEEEKEEVMEVDGEAASCQPFIFFPGRHHRFSIKFCLQLQQSGTPRETPTRGGARLRDRLAVTRRRRHKMNSF